MSQEWLYVANVMGKKLNNRVCDSCNGTGLKDGRIEVPKDDIQVSKISKNPNYRIIKKDTDKNI